MSSIPDFLNVLTVYGSDVVYHRADSTIPCPCLTPEGFRDPEWHVENPDQPVCNEAGMLPDPDHTVDAVVKAFMQPASFGRTSVARGQPLDILEVFGEIQTGDHIGIFPCEWNSVTLNFRNWSQSGEDYLEFNGLRFVVIAENLIPDPTDGNPNHHWELACRLIA